MYISTRISAAIGILCICVAAETNEQSDAEISQAPGAKLVSLLSLITDTKQQNKYFNNYPFDGAYRPYPNRKCPLCDSSVYPYCGEKLLHDACCCTDPYIHPLPYQCKLADCRFLHANNCREHRLIATCCCSDDYRSLLKSFTNS